MCELFFCVCGCVFGLCVRVVCVVEIELIAVQCIIARARMPCVRARCAVSRHVSSVTLSGHPVYPPEPNLLICTHAICRALAMMAQACERARGAGVVVVLIPASAHISDLLKPITGFGIGKGRKFPECTFMCVIDFRRRPDVRVV